MDNAWFDCNTAWKICLVFIGLTLLPATPRAAENGVISTLAPLNFKGIYQFSFGALTFGKGGVEITQTPARYEMTSDIMSTGIVNAFVRHSSHTTVTGTGADYRYPDLRYSSNYQTKKKAKTAMMVWDDGGITEEKVTPPETKRPPVPKAMKDKANDPLSLVFAMRHGLFDALKAGKSSFSLPLYDGRRLTQVNFRLVGPKMVQLGAAPLEVIQVDVSRRLLEGFTASELEDATKKKDPVLHVYFTRDERLLPVLFEVNMLLGTLRAQLVKECGAGESCLLGITG